MGQKQNYWDNIRPNEIEKKNPTYSTGSRLRWASSGCELFELLHFASQHVIVVSSTGSLGVQIKRQLVVILCQPELPPAMIKHSWWKTERCTDPLFIYKSMYPLTHHLFAFKLILLVLKFQDWCLLDMWKCGGCNCSPKLPWKLAAFGLIWRACRKKASDSWGQKKQACIKIYMYSKHAS